MNDHDDPRTLLPRPGATDADTLLARYGADLADDDLDEAQQKELLCALWQIMQAFVDLGFRVGAGETFTPKSDFGMDDVVHSLLLEDTAHETVAPEVND